MDYGLFGFFFMMMLFKGVFAAWPDLHRIMICKRYYQPRSPKEASKMTGFVSIILLPIRYSMIIGLTVLAFLYYNQLNLSNGAGGTDFERVLPAAINNFLPLGILGIGTYRFAGCIYGNIFRNTECCTGLYRQ